MATEPAEPVMIPIEGLAIGEIIYRTGDDFGPFGDHATVIDVVDEGCSDESYSVLVQIEGFEDATWISVPYGESVQHGGVGEPRSDMNAVRKAKTGDTVTVRSRSGIGALKTGTVTGRDFDELENPIIDYRTADGREFWAYDWQVVEFVSVDDRAMEAVEGAPVMQAAE